MFWGLVGSRKGEPGRRERKPQSSRSRLCLPSSDLLPALSEAAATVALSAPRWGRGARTTGSEDPIAEAFPARWSYDARVVDFHLLSSEFLPGPGKGLQRRRRQ